MAQFTAEKNYNVDESDLSTVHRPLKVLTAKGKIQVGVVTSGEPGVNNTCLLLGIVSALHSLFVVFYFPRL